MENTAASFKGILAKNSDWRQTSSEVLPGRAGLVLGWLTTFRQKPCCAGFFLRSKSKNFLPLPFLFASVKTWGKGAFLKCYTISDTHLQLMCSLPWAIGDLLLPANYCFKRHLKAHLLTLIWTPDLKPRYLALSNLTFVVAVVVVIVTGCVRRCLPEIIFLFFFLLFCLFVCLFYVCFSPLISIIYM